MEDTDVAHEYLGDFPEDDDKTQPTEEHLDAIHRMNELPASQGTDIVDSSLSNQGEVTSSQPQDLYSVTLAQVRGKPTDIEPWLSLVRLAEDFGEYEKIVETYEALLDAFPNTSSAQIAYITHVLDSQNTAKHQLVAGLFNRFLKTSPFVDLWKFYLSHVRKLNTDPNNRDIIRKAYEYALNHIGHDKESTDIWTDYIQFLKSGEKAATTWDEGQKMDAIRKAYQRAVQTPMENVKRLWEEYSEFETNLNKQLAKKFLSDLQTSHMQARTVLNNLQDLTSALLPSLPYMDHSRIWLPHSPTFSPEDKALVTRWKQYLKYEEGNPLEIEEKDRSQFHSRVQTVYRKALVRMRFFSEVWYMAYIWTMGVSGEPNLPENKRRERKEEALSLLKAGIDANPNSFVLNFAYAEVLEDGKNAREAHNVFQKFLDVLRNELDELDVATKAEESLAGSNQAGTTTTPAVGSSTAGIRSNNSSFTSQASDEQSSKSRELKDRRTEYGIAWIVYMRFARRAENPRSARDVFGKARKDKWTPWEVYEAAALMEYHCSKATDVAMRIFERGLEKFPDEEEFALRYLGFLISINDDSNARALFERVVTTFSPERARSLWERWARYEYQFGNLQAAQNLERRLSEVYPNDPPIKRFAERHRYLGTDAIAVRDLGFNFGRSGGQASTGRSGGYALGRTDTQQSLVSNVSSAAQSQVFGSTKRPSSPDPRRREETRTGDHGPPTKRQRPGSPPRERERWEGPQRRRHGSPSWERNERDRETPVRKEKEKEEEKPITLPPVLSWFIGVLPPPPSFDGPVFRTDDLMQVFRNAVIPSSTGIRPASPPPRPVGRPPPDYSPYQGPTPGRRGRY